MLYFRHCCRFSHSEALLFLCNFDTILLYFNIFVRLFFWFHRCHQSILFPKTKQTEQCVPCVSVCYINSSCESLGAREQETRKKSIQLSWQKPKLKLMMGEAGSKEQKQKIIDTVWILVGVILVQVPKVQVILSCSGTLRHEGHPESVADLENFTRGGKGGARGLGRRSFSVRMILTN